MGECLSLVSRAYCILRPDTISCRSQLTFAETRTSSFQELLASQVILVCLQQGDRLHTAQIPDLAYSLAVESPCQQRCSEVKEILMFGLFSSCRIEYTCGIQIVTYFPMPSCVVGAFCQALWSNKFSLSCRQQQMTQAHAEEISSNRYDFGIMY